MWKLMCYEPGLEEERICPTILFIFYTMLEFTTSTSEFTFYIFEEQDEVTYIGSLKNKSLASPPLQYSLLPPSIYFHLDKQTGDLYTTAYKLDREYLCPQDISNQCFVEIDVFVSSQEHSEIAKIKIFILDINDHAPFFTDRTITLAIQEDAAVGTVFPIDHSASDADAGQNSVLLYHLNSTDDVFKLGNNSQLVSLTLQQPLNHESKNKYYMDLIAIDKGLPPLSASALIIVQIMDVNDNCPVFFASNININLPRNTSINSTVAQLEAVDDDTGENSLIQYIYSNRVPTVCKKLFYLESTTGIIKLAASIPEDTPNNHKLTVLAIGPGCAPAVATVTLVIQEFKRKEPRMEFRLIAAQEGEGVSVKEDVPINTIIAILEIKDPDYSILRPVFINGTMPFSLKVSENSPDTYLLLTSGILDFELEQKYTIHVLGNATFDNLIVYQAMLNVKLEDVNDNAPQFPQSVLEASVEENNSPGAVILTLSTFDKDSGSNGNISYHFGGELPLEFSIDVSHGILVATVSFDREKKTSYTLTVVASDHGSPAKNSSCAVIINILDENDNAPMFFANELTFFVPENLPRHGKVGILNVTDADYGLNGEISVSVLNTTMLFSMAQNIIILEGSLDYESMNKHELWIAAHDKGNPPLSSTAKVNIMVLDTNDNAPLILLPDSNFSYVLVPPDTSKGSPVTKVHAVDYDAGLNGAVRYSGFGEMGPFGDLFKIDNVTGNITLKESIAGHHCGLYQFLVMASDQGYPEALSTIVRINILLNHSISNRSYLESVIMAETKVPTENQVVLLSPCTQYHKMAPFSWSLNVILFLVLVILCILFCVIGTLMIFCRRKVNDKRRKKADVQIPLKLNADYWDNIK
ncbi:protocadherin-20-like [Xenopus laevis]|uniref:Protocadherin-20-like n=1 Tax=Xenopus laevis TaxID=8355 RepID=A0A8J0TRJ6_XENLA|nr:protocadherin-20-like [Xenopus laevis]